MIGPRVIRPEGRAGIRLSHRVLRRKSCLLTNGRSILILRRLKFNEKKYVIKDYRGLVHSLIKIRLDMRLSYILIRSGTLCVTYFVYIIIESHVFFQIIHFLRSKVTVNYTNKKKDYGKRFEEILQM